MKDLTTNGTNNTMEIDLRPLPNMWKWTKLEECVDILDNRRIPINSDERDHRIAGKEQSELYPYYGATGLVGWIDDFIFDEEVVLLGEDGAPFLETKNKAYIVRSKFWVNNHAHVLRAKNGVTTNLFLMHYLNIFDYHDYVTGTTRLKLNQRRMREIPIILPPLEEQERIVARLEELLSDLEAGVGALERVLTGAKRYRASVLKAACEGKLFESRGTENSETGLPKGWRWAAVKELADGSKNALKAGPFGSSLKKEYYVPKGYKIYGQEQVIRGDPYFGDYYIDEDRYQLLKSNAVKTGDILVSLVGTIGKVLILPDNIEPGIINPRLVKLSLDKNLIYSRYFKFYMESETAKHYFSTVSHGETMDVLNLGILKTLPIPLPPLEEQRRIVAEVERRLESVRAVETAVEAGLKRAGRLQQAVLRSAFEGRL